MRRRSALGRARGAKNKTERATKRQTENAADGFFDEKFVAGSAGPEARYGSGRTSKDPTNRTTDGRKANVAMRPHHHRLTVPRSLFITASVSRGLRSRRDN